MLTHVGTYVRLFPSKSYLTNIGQNTGCFFISILIVEAG